MENVMTIAKQPDCIWDAKAQLGEGPVWDPAKQCLYWVDIMQSTLHSYQPDNGHKQSYPLGNQLSSVAPCDNGELIATFDFGLAHIRLSDLRVNLLCALETHLPDNRFNDGCLDTQGQYWFGSMDNKQSEQSGRFYRFDGQDLTPLSRMEPVCITNGPTFSPDGRYGYFTDTLKGKIYQLDLNEPSSPEALSLFIQFSADQGFPDGMCCDSEGHLWVCHWGGGKVSRFDPLGKLCGEIKLPVPQVTKCTFGGSDMRTLFITTAATGLSDAQLAESPLSGGLFAINLEQQGFNVPAFPLNQFQEALCD